MGNYCNTLQNKGLGLFVSHVSYKALMSMQIVIKIGTRIHVYTHIGRIEFFQWETSIGNGDEFMRESMVEKKLVTEVKKRGGHALKFVSPGFDGVPDRLILFPNGISAFVEVKSPGKKMRPLQLKRKRALEELGFRVYCIDNVEMIGGILDEIEIRAIT